MALFAMTIFEKNTTEIIVPLLTVMLSINTDTTRMSPVNDNGIKRANQLFEQCKQRELPRAKLKLDLHAPQRTPALLKAHCTSPPSVG